MASHELYIHPHNRGLEIVSISGVDLVLWRRIYSYFHPNGLLLWPTCQVTPPSGPLMPTCFQTRLQLGPIHHPGKPEAWIQTMPPTRRTLQENICPHSLITSFPVQDTGTQMIPINTAKAKHSNWTSILF